MKFIHEDDSIDFIVIGILNTLNGPLQSTPIHEVENQEMFM